MKLAFKQWYAVISLIMLSGCASEKKDKEVKVGEYVYVDKYNCVHVNQRCFKLTFSDGENGEDARYMVHRVRVKDLTGLDTTCSFCVTDEAYSELENRIKVN